MDWLDYYSCQYVRLTTTGTQKNGFAGALWNIKVFGEFEAEVENMDKEKAEAEFGDVCSS